ncbi:MAG TPA: ABC transporter permease [Conexibacter sp.]|nr:ABC transporter permease [Conexibacter sp.]
MTRTQYLLQRFLFAILTVLIAVTVNFFIFRAAPGDPTTLLALKPNTPPALVHNLRHEYGLDQGLLTQYVKYLGQLGGLHFGVSTANHAYVVDNIKTDLLNTLPMVLIATSLALLLGLVIGVLIAWMRNTKAEGSGLLAIVVTYALPTQWVGLILLYLFAGVLPSGGIEDQYLIDPSFTTHLVDKLRHMILPGTAFALFLLGQYAFIVRSSMLDVMGEDYMLTARAKGLSTSRQLIRHGLRNALLPITSLTALILGQIVAGAILVETVFSYPGIGQATASAVGSRDYPMLQGIFVVLTVSVVACNLIADVIAVRLDPRVTQ